MLCISMLLIFVLGFCFFFFKQKTAYEMRISDWSSDVCSSDLGVLEALAISLDIFRGRYRKSFEHPSPIPANQVQEYKFRLPTVKIGRASCRERVCQYV